MRTDDYVGVMGKTESRNRLLALGFVLMLVVNVALGLGLLSMSRKQFTVLVPASGVHTGMKIGSSTADNEYITSMATFAALSFLNFDPKNVAGQFKDLSNMSTGVVHNELMQAAADYIKMNLTSRAVIYEITVTDQKATVKGRRIKYILDKAVEDKKYELQIFYKIDYGRFYIVEMILI